MAIRRKKATRPLFFFFFFNRMPPSHRPRDSSWHGMQWRHQPNPTLNQNQDVQQVRFMFSWQGGREHRVGTGESREPMLVAQCNKHRQWPLRNSQGPGDHPSVQRLGDRCGSASLRPVRLGKTKSAVERPHAKVRDTRVPSSCPVYHTSRYLAP